MSGPPGRSLVSLKADCTLYLVYQIYYTSHTYTTIQPEKFGSDTSKNCGCGALRWLPCWIGRGSSGHSGRYVLYLRFYYKLKSPGGFRVKKSPFVDGLSDLGFRMWESLGIVNINFLIFSSLSQPKKTRMY